MDNKSNPGSELDCSQSSIFSQDRQDIARLTVHGRPPWFSISEEERAEEKKQKSCFFFSSPRVAPRGSNELLRFRPLLAIKRLLYKLRENAVVANWYFKNNTFTAVTRDSRFSIAGVQGYHFSKRRGKRIRGIRGKQKGAFSIKNWCKGPVIFYRRAGGSKDLVLNKVKFGRSLLWMLLHWSDPP